MSKSKSAIIQKYFADTSTGQYYIRQSYDGTNWNNWCRVDNFGCNTADALASLLGGQWETIQPDNVDFNDLKPMQRCEVITGHGQANAPSNMSEGTSIFTFGVLNPYNQSLKHGFQIGGRENKIAIRACGYDAWGSWLYITA